MADDKQLGDGPIETKFRETMNAIAEGLDTILNGKNALTGKIERKTGFVVLLFPYNDRTGRCNYISNGANREDIVKMFKEQIKRFEEPKP
jgi:hypothetical protein